MNQIGGLTGLTYQAAQAQVQAQAQALVNAQLEQQELVQNQVIINRVNHVNHNQLSHLQGGQTQAQRQ